MSRSILSVEGLAGGYGQVQVLWSVDLHVETGQIVSLIGSNGAGKTTLLRTISGLLSPSAGRIEYSGRDIAGLTPQRIVSFGVIHVLEGRRLFAGMSVRDNLMMGAYHRRDGSQAVRRDMALVFDLFPRLYERRQQDASTLSGGEQQMCAIARGIMAAPTLLMIDEMSLGLAPQLVEQLSETLVEIKNTGLSILLVEQDVMTALELSDIAFVMDRGRITHSGASDSLADDPMVKEAYLGVPAARSD